MALFHARKANPAQCWAARSQRDKPFLRFVAPHSGSASFEEFPHRRRPGVRWVEVLEALVAQIFESLPQKLQAPGSFFVCLCRGQGQFSVLGHHLAESIQLSAQIFICDLRHSWNERLAARGLWLSRTTGAQDRTKKHRHG